VGQRIRDGEPSPTIGIGDTTARAKINLVGNDGGRVVVALVPRVTLPTSDQLGGGVYAGGLTVPIAVGNSLRSGSPARRGRE